MRDITVDDVRQGDEIVLFSNGHFTPPTLADPELVEDIRHYEGLDRILLVGRPWPRAWTQQHLLGDIQERMREVSECTDKWRTSGDPADGSILNVHITALHEAVDDYLMGLSR